MQYPSYRQIAAICAYIAIACLLVLMCYGFYTRSTYVTEYCHFKSCRTISGKEKELVYFCPRYDRTIVAIRNTDCTMHTIQSSILLYSNKIRTVSFSNSGLVEAIVGLCLAGGIGYFIMMIHFVLSCMCIDRVEAAAELEQDSLDETSVSMETSMDDDTESSSTMEEQEDGIIVAGALSV